jgi:hypothetical protein
MADDAGIIEIGMAALENVEVGAAESDPPDSDQNFGLGADRLGALFERNFTGPTAYDCLHDPLR